MERIKYDPYPFQEKAIKKGLEVLKSDKERKEILVAPTGAGKSIIIAELAQRLPKKGNILVVQPSKELLIQNLEKIESLGVKPSVFSASLGSKDIGRITYATRQSLKPEMFKKSSIKYVIVDECHLGARNNSVFVSFLKKIGVNNVLGLTASPVFLDQTMMQGAVLKMMNRTRGKFFKDICHVVPIKEVIKLKKWTPLEYKKHEFDRSGLVLNSTGADYTTESIQLNYVQADLDSKILGVLRTIPKNESVLIFVPDISNIEQLAEKIKGCGYVHSKVDAKYREKVVNGFKDGSIQIAISQNVLLTGFDKPDLIHVIDAYPTNSFVVHYQKYGRAVRIHPNKKVAYIHDLVGNTEKFGEIEKLNFENIPGYGWGMFTDNILLTAVPMSEKLNVTKEQLISGKGLKKGSGGFDFSMNMDTKDDCKINFGKHKGKTFKAIYKEDKGYLLWMNNEIKKGTFKMKHPTLERLLKETFR